MGKRRLIYAAVLCGCIGFVWCNQLRFSWVLLIGVLVLPLFSLLLSLPAILKIKLTVICPESVQIHAIVKLQMKTECPFPVPPYQYRIRVRRAMTGEEWVLGEDLLPARHCGQLVCRAEEAYICDYLGLFRIKIKNVPEAKVTVRPVPIKMEEPPELRQYLTRAWKPKPGGGFSENHELRLYRPGDNLNQVHWKLTAKTGKLILREPMEPARGQIVLTIAIRGSGKELDRKFGRLLWLSSHLLELGAVHEIRALTGTGISVFAVDHASALADAVNHLLAEPPAAETSTMELPRDCGWIYEIGGGTDEA